MYEKWATDQRTEGTISHSKDGSVIRRLVGKLMDNDNDNDNEQVSVSSLQTGCTNKQITAQKLCKIMISNSQEAEGSEADKCPCHPL
jgi:hypothetical protein